MPGKQTHSPTCPSTWRARNRGPLYILLIYCRLRGTCAACSRERPSTLTLDNVRGIVPAPECLGLQAKSTEVSAHEAR